MGLSSPRAAGQLKARATLCGMATFLGSGAPPSCLRVLTLTQAACSLPLEPPRPRPSSQDPSPSETRMAGNATGGHPAPRPPRSNTVSGCKIRPFSLGVLNLTQAACGLPSGHPNPRPSSQDPSPSETRMSGNATGGHPAPRPPRSNTVLGSRIPPFSLGVLTLTQAACSLPLEPPKPRPSSQDPSPSETRMAGNAAGAYSDLWPPRTDCVLGSRVPHCSLAVVTFTPSGTSDSLLCRSQGPPLISHEVPGLCETRVPQSRHNTGTCPALGPPDS